MFVAAEKEIRVKLKILDLNCGFALGQAFYLPGAERRRLCGIIKNTPCRITSGNLMICFVLQVLQQSFFYNLNNSEL